MNRKKNKGQSLARMLKRGNAVLKLDKLTGFLNVYRRTTTSKEHTVFVTSFKP